MIDDEIDENRSFRAFCEHEGCLWSSYGYATEEMADDELGAHNLRKHPGLPVTGAVDEM